jgi:hypothetical protein
MTADGKSRHRALNGAQAHAPYSCSSSAGKLNEAYERVLASDVRYWFVIDAAPLK